MPPAVPLSCGSNGLLTVHARFKPSLCAEPLADEFIVDTGSHSAFTLFVSAAAMGELVHAGAEEEQVWSLREHRVLRVHADWIRVGGLYQPALTGHAVVPREERRLAPLLGLAFFQRWQAFQLDLAANQLRLFSSTAAVPEPAVAVGIRPVTLTLLSPRPNGYKHLTVAASLENLPCRAILDTGFSGLVAMPAALIDRLSLNADDAHVVDVITPYETSTARFVEIEENLILMDVSIPLRGRALVVDDDRPGALAGDEIVLGMQFLRQFDSLYVDFSMGRVVMVPAGATRP